MSVTYNPESELIAEIERLEIEVRQTLDRIQRARLSEDKYVLNKLVNEMKNKIQFLRRRLD